MDVNMSLRILVVDDEEAIRESLREIFMEDGYEVLLAADEKETFEKITDGADLVLLDIKIGSEDGIEILRRIKARFPYIPVVMITGYGTVQLAKEAFKIGAHDFLEKPLRLVQVRTCVRNALEGVTLRKQLHRSSGHREPVIISQAMKQLYSRASRLAYVREPVVIMGPSGSGKDLLARHLHYEGNRAQGPFIVTNAASMPLSLAEDELFGHERGAFTGAEKKRAGCFEQAHGGTLFLDEIGDMDPQVQAKVLRVLETGEFVRLGSTTPVRVDVRLICATHKNLEELVSRGQFRHDLWYRINAFVLNVPGLDTRKDDIAPLAQYFLRLMCSDLGIEKKMTPSAMNRLSEINFPGNVRELKHLIARLAVYTDSSDIESIDIDKQRGSGNNTQAAKSQILSKNTTSDIPDFKTAKLEFEKSYLCRALESCNGNITATARLIGMAQSNLSRKLKEMGIG